MLTGVADLPPLRVDRDPPLKPPSGVQPQDDPLDIPFLNLEALLQLLEPFSFPCPIMTLLGFKNSIDIPFNKLRELYDPIVNKMRWQILAKDECEKCIYYLRKRCQGGCLVYKFLSHKEEINKLYKKQLKFF
jgi:radical SAM protein with 4Fe4S-binding SPASM domain